jgi:hypothetical protein
MRDYTAGNRDEDATGEDYPFVMLLNENRIKPAIVLLITFE